MLLDILDNLPRLRLSKSLFSMILWILKECGVPNVPSYDAFHKMQTVLRKCCGSEPQLAKSMLGNVFYINDIRETIARVRCLSRVSEKHPLTNNRISLIPRS